MTRHQLGVLLCRVLALYALYAAVTTTLVYVPILIDTVPAEAREAIEARGYEPASGPSPIWVVSGAIAGPWVVAIGLWFAAGWLTRRMIPDGPLPAVTTGFDGRVIFSTAFVVVGLFWLLDGIVNVGIWVAQEWALRQSTDGGAVVTINRYFGSSSWGLVPSLLLTAIGLWFVLGSRGIAAVLTNLRAGISRVRTAGTEKESPRRSASDGD